MQTLICTTGTSIAKGQVWNGDSSLYQQAIQRKLEEYAETHSSAEFLHWASAETNSLVRLKLDSKKDRIALLHSETEDGKICAEEVQKIINNNLDVQSELFCLQGLQVENAERFRREGIQSLFETLERLRQRDWNLRLNVTGGFKSVVPYMTLYGQFHQLEVVYIFERSSQLINLPPAPINFDYERLKIAEEALRWLGKKGVGGKQGFFNKMPEASREDQKWCATLLEDDGESVILSAFGLILYQALQARPTKVFLHQKARQIYEQHKTHKSGEQFSFMLKRVAEPLWRQQKIHAHSSELDIYKPGNTGERMGAFLLNGSVYVAQLWPNHDLYEQEATSERIADYPVEEFTLWNL